MTCACTVRSCCLSGNAGAITRSACAVDITPSPHRGPRDFTSRAKFFRRDFEIDVNTSAFGGAIQQAAEARATAIRGVRANFGDIFIGDLLDRVRDAPSRDFWEYSREVRTRSPTD